jgi:FkbM family methyltransferase
MPLRIVRRAVGSIARRLERPELVSAFYPLARRDEHEAIAIRAVLASSLRRDSCFIDVGTNRGGVLREAVRSAPDGRHLAFEPVPQLAAEVEREFPSVDCRRLALAAQPGSAEFCWFRNMDGWSGLRRSPEVSDAKGRPELISVTVSTLDAEVTDRAPSLVKIDVEGAELDVLRGGRSLLTETRPALIVEHLARASAVYGASSADVWDLLSEYGYEVFSVTGEGPVSRAQFGTSELVVNWLARPLR